MKVSNLSHLPCMLSRGFSLVEVTIALGIVVFALVAILGVIPIGLNSVSHSARIVQADVMARDLVSTLRTRPDYKALMPEYPLPDLTASGLTFPLATNVLISANGLVMTDANAAAFAADYTITRDAASDRLLYVHLRLAWPPQAPASARQSTEITSAVLLP
jgi:type II secretory pathway pseudopilin PulG